jgi:hypothetical protein
LKGGAPGGVRTPDPLIEVILIRLERLLAEVEQALAAIRNV